MATRKLATTALLLVAMWSNWALDDMPETTATLTDIYTVGSTQNA